MAEATTEEREVTSDEAREVLAREAQERAEMCRKAIDAAQEQFRCRMVSRIDTVEIAPGVSGLTTIWDVEPMA